MAPADLRLARKRLGLSQAGLAGALRLGQNGGRTVRRWESGDVPITGPVTVAVEMMVSRADDYAVMGLKARARGVTLSAIKSGKIVRPETCSSCGVNPGRAADGRARIQAHHGNGYDRPLDVTWLCVQCHHKHHLEHGPGPVEVALELMLKSER